MTQAASSSSSNSLLRKVAAFLNVEPGEERLIGLLILLYFIISLGYAFSEAMTFGIFLAEYGVKGLPYSYITIAILASALAALYIKLGGRFSFSKLLSINLIFLGSGAALIWLTLNTSLFHAAAFILPLWFRITLNLGDLAVWPLAGSLFDFRQGKRLFPLLGGGSWLASIVGGLFVPVLVKFFGTVNLLLLAGLSFAIAFFVVRHITRTYIQPAPSKPQVVRPTRAAKPAAGLFKNRYILLIFIYTMLWWAAFYFVDNIFFNRAFTQYPDANQLASFIGNLLIVMGIVALISSLVLSSRIIARFGLLVGLVGMPLVVLVSLGILAVSGSLGAPLIFIFGLSTFARVIFIAFGFSLSQSANAIVFQSLPDTQRGRVQTTAGGVLQPIAVGLAGISLLALTEGLKLDYVGLAYVFVGLGVALLVVIFALNGKYIYALTEVITRRRLGDNVILLPDSAGIALLKDRLKDEHAGSAIYALTKLEELDAQAVLNELPALMCHPAPEVRREAFMRIETARLQSVLDEVQDQAELEIIPTVKEYALRALGAITERSPLLVQALSETDIPSLRGALVGLLKYGDEPAARQKLDQLLTSSSNAERSLGLEVLGALKRREYFPHLVAACDSPNTSRLAGLALASIGAPALPEIEAGFHASQASSQRLITLSRVLGRIGGIQAQAVLLSRLATPDAELRTQLIQALSQSRYHTSDLPAIQSYVRVEAAQAAWVSAAMVDLGEQAEHALIQAALSQFLAQVRSRTLLLLSFGFDEGSIRKVREALMSGTGSQLSYALEIMDVQLPAEWKKMVMPVLENLSASDRLQRLSVQFPQTMLSAAERLSEITQIETLPDWMRACAMYAAHQGDPAMLSTVEKVLILKSVPMFSQTPDNVLAEVADLLEDMDVVENETIFNKGDSGDSLYVILEGRVRVHDGERILNYLGERNVFGEMALLDTEPRSASVTAAEPTRLFRLNQAPFYELISEHPEVATGIIRVLTHHLRNRVEDIARLNTRIQSLEGAAQG